jgi:hypothetical protein
VIGVGCGMLGGARVYHPDNHRCGGACAIELKQPMRDCRSYSPNHRVKGGDCCGGAQGGGRGATGGRDEGPTYCTE